MRRGIVVCCAALVPLAAGAANYTVLDTSDTMDIGTLRWSIAQANANAGADTISFDASVTGTIALGSSLSTITEDLTINGPGASVLSLGGGAFESMPVFDEVDVTVSGLTFAGGGPAFSPTLTTGSLTISNCTFSAHDDTPISATGSGPICIDTCIFASNVITAAHGGAIYVSGGTLSVVATEFTTNSTTAAPACGGAVYAECDATFEGCTFTGNTVVASGGAVFLDDPGGTDGRIWSFTDCTFTTNGASAGDGGAVVVAHGTASFTGCTFSGNTAAGSGGAIYAFDATAEDLTVDDSTFSGNTSSLGGAAIGAGTGYTLVVSGCTFDGNAAGTDGGAIQAPLGTITSSTISGNAADVNGGGIATGDAGTTLWIRNSTIASNTADDDDNASGNGGGIYVDGGALTLTSTIVADNVDRGTESPDVHNESGTVGATYSLVETAAGGHGIADGVDDNIVGTDPGLQVLADNGGTTQTHAILATSAAVDGGINPAALATDQRGSYRTSDYGGASNAADGTDIGAFEFLAPPIVASDPADQSVIVDQVAVFSVTAAGAGTLTYQWKRDAANVTGGTGGTTDTYTTDPTTLGDSGAQFTCEVTGAGGTTASAAAMLTVSNPLPADDDGGCTPGAGGASAVALLVAAALLRRGVPATPTE